MNDESEEFSTEINDYSALQRSEYINTWTEKGSLSQDRPKFWFLLELNLDKMCSYFI